MTAAGSAGIADDGGAGELDEAEKTGAAGPAPPDRAAAGSGYQP
jgi:hypothetical protein